MLFEHKKISTIYPTQDKNTSLTVANVIEQEKKIV